MREIKDSLRKNEYFNYLDQHVGQQDMVFTEKRSKSKADSDIV
jgi:hypothetical protein